MGKLTPALTTSNNSLPKSPSLQERTQTCQQPAPAVGLLCPCPELGGKDWLGAPPAGPGPGANAGLVPVPPQSY